MTTFIELDTTPFDEQCVQVGDIDYMGKARTEAKIYIHQLIRTYGSKPPRTKFKISHNHHDFDDYLNIKFYFNSNVKEDIKYVELIEDTVALWDEQSKKELHQAGLHECLTLNQVVDQSNLPL